MKNYTDLNQSKVLVEILPLESADAHYVREITDFMGNPVDGKWSEAKLGNPEKANYFRQNFSSFEKLPCWSLAALLDMIDSQSGLGKDYDLWICYDNSKSHITKHYEHPIDAAFEMVVWLKENKKL